MKEDRAEMKEIMVVLVIEKEGERKKKGIKRKDRYKKISKIHSISLSSIQFSPFVLRTTDREILLIFLLSICRKNRMYARVAWFDRTEDDLHQAEIKISHR